MHSFKVRFVETEQDSQAVAEALNAWNDAADKAAGYKEPQSKGRYFATDPNRKRQAKAKEALAKSLKRGWRAVGKDSEGFEVWEKEGTC